MTLVALSFIMAFCSLCYNFIFTHLLAATLGSSTANYCLGIGLYVFSLGLSSIYFDSIRKKISWLFLIRLELYISLTAILGCLWILALDFYRQPNFIFFKILYYLPIVILGALSGLELPSLLYMNKKNKFQNLIISSDYIGMSAVCISFAVIAVPYLGLVATLIAGVSLNLVSLVILVLLKKEQHLALLCSILSACITSFFFSPQIETLVRSVYLSAS